MMISEVIGFLAGAIGIFPSLPQTLRIRKLGHAGGVSLPTWLILYAYVCSWIGYGIATHSPAMWITNTLSALLIITVLFAILANHLRTYMILLVIPIIFIAFTLTVPSSVLSTVLLVFSVNRVPQAIRSWHTWKTRSPSAVSIHTWFLSGLSAGLWIAYGVLGHRGIVEITSLIGFILAAIIIGFELISARNNRVAMVLGDPISTGN